MRQVVGCKNECGTGTVQRRLQACLRSFAQVVHLVKDKVVLAAGIVIQFGIRLGKNTKLICSTTPKPKDLIIDLLGREGDDVVVTKASTYANIKNLAPSRSRSRSCSMRGRG